MARVPFFPGEPRPLIFAHRGVSARAPENTMAAFRLAKAAGAAGIELDIHLLATGELVVIHDEDAMRTCGQPLRFPGASLAEVRTLDAGSWKGSEWTGERVPLLAEVFEEFRDSMMYDIEIKAKSAAATGIEPALARLLADFGLASRVAVSSFNPVSLARFKALEPRVPTGIIWCDEAELPWYLRRGEGRWIARADFLKPHRELVRRPSSAGRPRLPWVVDDAAEARTLLGLGVAGLISNDPAALALG